MLNLIMNKQHQVRVIDKPCKSNKTLDTQDIHDDTIQLIEQHYSHILKLAKDLVEENVELSSENLRLKGEINDLMKKDH